MLKKISKKQPVKIILLVLFVLFLVSRPFGFLTALPETPCLFDSSSEKTVLERCKSVEEIRKLKSENSRSLAVTLIPLLAPFATILIAFWTLILNNQKEKQAQRDKDTKDKERQLQEEAARRDKDTKDKERQLDEQYNDIVVGLGEESLSLRASRAGALLNFLQPDHLRFLDDILTIVSVNLKKSICDEPAIQECLTRVLEKAVRAKLEEKENKPLLKNLNLSRTSLFRLNFQGLDFRGVNVDIAFAKMSYANLNDAKIPKLLGMRACLDKAKISRCDLTDARLNKARCQKAQFHKSILIRATFKEADLRGAEFYQARLQSVHFEKARLQGANFTKANLADAYFTGAKLDDSVKKTILKSYKQSWKLAKFDDDVQKELDELYSLGESQNCSESNVYNI